MLNNIKSIGEKRQKYLQKLGILNHEDLIEYFPKDYEDRTKLQKIIEIYDGENSLIKGELVKPVINRYIRKNLSIQTATIHDGTGECELTWFNQTYLANTLKQNTYYYFYGKTEKKFNKYIMTSPEYEEVSLSQNAGNILPIYRLTKGISQNILRNIIRKELSETEIEDKLPNYIIKEEKLLIRNEAIKNIHFPKDFTNLDNAKETLIFEELFLLQTALLYFKNSSKIKKGCKCDKSISLNEISKELPFELTLAQRKSLLEIEKDLENEKTMERLLQGDVGSGKTIVAILASYKAVKSGYQVAVMVPTAILALQHLQSFKSILEKYSVNIEILKSGITKKEKTSILKKLKSGEIDIIIGTHSLIEENVEFKNLGFVITDEQHRFGVRQRGKILSKGHSPNVLVMSATPIPRTLGLILYGDLDISIMDELPKGRKKIATAFARYNQSQKINLFIKQQLKQGRQGYVVCPLVEDNTDVSLKSVEDVYKEYLKEFSEYKVAYLHGKMKEKEKDEVMKEFLEKKIDLLIATTVIEVGIDVPNANIIVIENAERFGLAVLHQLRGRVGRGEAQSYCILKTDSQNEITQKRIQIMCETNDGFVISEKDLELRGTGDFFGTKQHGVPEFKIANLFEDMDILKRVQIKAKEILEDDPKLLKEKNSLIKNNIDKMINTNL